MSSPPAAPDWFAQMFPRLNVFNDPAVQRCFAKARPVPPRKVLPATCHLREGETYDPNKVKRWEVLTSGQRSLKVAVSYIRRKGWSTYQKRERRRRETREHLAGYPLRPLPYITRFVDGIGTHCEIVRERAR